MEQMSRDKENTLLPTFSLFQSYVSTKIQHF